MMTSEPVTKSKRKRASQFERQNTPRRMEITDRDCEIVASVSRYRVLTQSQLQRLHFPSKNTAQVRLALLWQHGYLRRVFPLDTFATFELLYALDKKGADLLQTHQLVPHPVHLYRGKTANPFSLAHMLGINDVRISIELAARKNNFEIATWRDDLETKANYDRVQIERRLVPIIPDAYFIVKTPRTFRFLLEYDRSTEGLKTIERKLRAYQVFIESGKCERRFGTSKIRILFVADKPGKRLEHMHTYASRLPLAPFFWFSDAKTLAHADPLTHSVWANGQPDNEALITPTPSSNN